MESPDENATAMGSQRAEPLRYDHHTLDVYESAGLIAELTPQNARVLDVGCAGGALSEIVAKIRSATIIGIEPDPIRANAARERGFEVYTGELSATLLEKLGLFDAVIFADVLEHVANPSDLLHLARNAVRRGGVVIASVPNAVHWSMRLDIVRGRFEYQASGLMDATHLRWFTARTLQQLFERSGYKLLRCYSTAGVESREYHQRFPWRHLRKWRSRVRVIRFLARRWPNLFGFQHVIVGIPDVS